MKYTYIYMHIILYIHILVEITFNSYNLKTKQEIRRQTSET